MRAILTAITKAKKPDGSQLARPFLRLPSKTK